MATIRITFTSGESLSTRNERFREEVRKFQPGSTVFLERDGYQPLRLHEASNDDVMFCTSIYIIGTLQRASGIILPN